MPRGWTIVLATGLAVVVGLAAQLGKATLVDTCVLILLAEALLGIVSIEWHLRRRLPERVEHIQRESDIVDRARHMRRRAKREVHCIWCSMEYDDDLRKYFDEFRGVSAIVCRLINVRKRPGDVANHLELFIDEIKNGKYVVTSTSHEAFEFFIVDRAETLLLVPHPTRYGLSEGIYSPDADFAYAMFHMYRGLAFAGNQLVIPKDQNDNDVKSTIDKWIKDSIK